MTDTTIEQAAQSLLMTQEPAAEAEEVTQEAPEPEEVQDDSDIADEVEASEENTEDDAEFDDEAEAEQDEADEDDDGVQEPEQPLISVKVDGKEVQVSLDDLKRSYSGQEYIQKGMQDAAAKRKEAEAMLANLQTAQEQFMQTVQALQEKGLAREPQKPDPAMLQTDPIGYMAAQAEYDNAKAEYDAQQAQVRKVSEQNAAMQQQAMQQMLAQQQQILAERIPDFADPEKGKAIRAELRNTGAEYGFTEQELGNISDARAVQVLHDAAQWRKLQASKAEAKKKPEAPRTVKPTARRSKPKTVVRKEMKQQAKKTQDTRAWANLLLEPKNG